MARFWKLTIALTAAAALFFSSVTGMVLWRLWQHPPRIRLRSTAEGLSWQGAGYAALMRLKDARMDWLMIWRSDDLDPPASIPQ